MLSRARNLFEDQLLVFSLVPISQVVGKGKVTEDYSLSSTDLFHSPAGTVQLTLSLDTSFAPYSSMNLVSESAKNSSVSSELVLLDIKISQVMLDTVEYSRIEFPDISLVKKNQKMVSEYFNFLGYGSISGSMSMPFLHLGTTPQLDNCEMSISSPVEFISPNESIQNSAFNFHFLQMILVYSFKARNLFSW
ncbi:hypothetical protein RIF29_17810 [Crotalaria pallida]|uniref:Uncharacterized protein n=1 Tax=Crotalaria pallida TaxID=3830 RepID=A0AAN9FK26_CROPI